MNIQNDLRKIGLFINLNSGHLSYVPEFRPLKLSVQLMIIRHGETYGNCGQSTANGEIDHELVSSNIRDRDKRIYQGDVDTAINQLTQRGRQHAFEAATKLEDKYIRSGWIPDLILHSPLTRAKDTGTPFITRNGFTQRYVSCEHIKEMSFGAWENRRICDMHASNQCHLLYLNQNALVKESGLNCNGNYQNAECFGEVILRAHQFIQELNKQYPCKKIILFTHSMFGAACCILAGFGQQVENGNYLAFDGKKKNGENYSLAFAEPVPLFMQTHAA